MQKKKKSWEQMKEDEEGITFFDFFSTFCLYNKEHEMVATWQKGCFSLDYSHQSFAFIQGGNGNNIQEFERRLDLDSIKHDG